MSVATSALDSRPLRDISPVIFEYYYKFKLLLGDLMADT